MSDSQPQERPTILVVEDSDDVRELLVVWLKRQGFRMLEASDGSAAVAIARREYPDLIIMDLSLPVLDGLTAMQSIREIEELCEVPIIACSAHTKCEWADRALLAGCAEFIRKPVDFGAMEMAINRLLSPSTKAT